MRPLQLTLTAFGPFRGEQRVDFEALGQHPLFLINGPTGCGKTTLLDAICFALYGRTTGDDREASQMRCDYADPDTLTEVVLTFELGGKRYRIRRVPEQQRPKARGEGTTTQSAEAQLWKLPPGEEEQLLVPSRVTEATQEIEQLTGLSVAQFRQVMVLPQGKFRELLLAESKQREAIFSQLFQTRIYRQLEELLKERAAAIRQEVDKGLQIREMILQGVGLEQTQQVQQELDQLVPELRRAEQQLKQAEKAHAESLEQLQEAKYLQAIFRRLAELKNRQHQLQSHLPEMERQRVRLQRGQQADKLNIFYRSLRDGQMQLARAFDQQKSAQRTVEQCQTALNKSEEEHRRAEALVGELETAKQTLHTLQGYRERGDQLQRATSDLQQAQKRERQAKREQTQQQELVKETVAKQETSEKQLVDLRQNLEYMRDVSLELQQLTGWLGERQELERITESHRQLQATLQKAEREGQRLAGELEAEEQRGKKLELAWHQGQAALLARELMPETPCPVCGSREHPSPAMSDEEIPGEQQLEDSRRQVKQARERLQKARDAYAENRRALGVLDQQMAGLQQRLGEACHLSLEQLREKEQALLKASKQREQWEEQARQEQQSFERLKRQEQEQRQRLVDFDKEWSEARARVASAEAALRLAEQELPPEYREASRLQGALQEHENRVQELTKHIELASQAWQRAKEALAGANAGLSSAEVSRGDAETALAAAEREWQSRLADSPFSDQPEFLQARLTEQEQTRQLQALREYELECERNATAVRQQEEALSGRSEPDLPTLEAGMQKRLAEKEQAFQAWREMDKRHASLREAENKLQENQRQSAELERHYALVGTLSEVANGQTGDKVSLQRFVLSVLLDDVLLEASRRLQLMSRGRYQLLRKSERSKGNRASGLELEVEDGYTGRCRPVATLSGGESFLAALSLALGLSDVVQAYSGGIRLDTLFIDEGFGSLDPESLDLAIRTLVDLQSSGRMIGIISHVAELKEQLPLRLDITSSRAGSRITQATPWTTLE